MRVVEVLTSLTFRFIARYVTVLSATVFAVLALLYAYFSYNYFTELNGAIRDELDTLELVYRGQSLPGVRQYVRDQTARPGATDFSYLVSDREGNKLAGDLPAEPRYREFASGWLRFQVSLFSREEQQALDFLARSRKLEDGPRLLVARNYADLVERGSLVFDTLIRAMVATLILGVIGGFVSASFALRRMEEFSRRLSSIVRGNTSQRLPVAGEEGFLREISLVANGMLDQMALLMQGVRQVSDNIAHDLRTPLTRIRNSLNQLRPGLDAERQQAVDRIIEDCDDLLSSFNALLRISTLESGSRPAAESSVDLAALLRDVVDLYEPLANERDLALVCSGPDSLLLRGDGDLLFQMFANLVDNAVKYTPEGGNIDVAWQKRAAGGASVSIADTGPGISAVDREHVFRRFYRVEASRGQQPGHGLGLSLVHAIAQYHRGAVSLGDNAPGLRVEVELP